MKSVLETAFNNRLTYVERESGISPKVKDDQKRLDEIMHQLLPIITNEDYDKLENAINLLRASDTEAGYRIGIADGIQLQQEVNSLIKGGR